MMVFRLQVDGAEIAMGEVLILKSFIAGQMVYDRSAS